MLKKIRIRLLKDGNLQLSRERVALRADAKDPDRIVWECEHDAQATVRFVNSSPFELIGPIGMGTIMTPRPASSPASYEYVAQDFQGRNRREGMLLVARTGPRPKTKTITIAREVSPMRCRVRRHTDEVVWLCPGDSTARIEFEKSPFLKDEFDVYELTAQPNGDDGEYKYTVYVDDRRIDPVIIIDPPP